jgi:serine protease inhibitor
VSLSKPDAEWIVIDRPFLFAIRERFSGTILFLGRIMDPAAT